MPEEAGDTITKWWWVPLMVLAAAAGVIFFFLGKHWEELGKEALTAVLEAIAGLLAFGPLLYWHRKELLRRSKQEDLRKNLVYLASEIQLARTLMLAHKSVPTIKEQVTRLGGLKPTFEVAESAIQQFSSPYRPKIEKILIDARNSVDAFLKQYPENRHKATELQNEFERRSKTEKEHDALWAKLLETFSDLDPIVTTDPEKEPVSDRLSRALKDVERLW